MNKQISVWAALISAMYCVGACCHAEQITAPSAKQNEALARWQSLKYGMFIHYGMSTFTGIEHDLGNQPSVTYAPTNLDVDQWIRVAQDAGMKYAVLTSKHVAGHCLWDSKVQWKGKEFDYDVTTSSDPTDVVGQFVDACGKYGIKPGLYYCLEDYRNNSNYHMPNPKRASYNLPSDYFQLVKDQLEELLRRYPEVFYLWLDIPVQASVAQRTDIYNHIKRINPSCLVLYNIGMTRTPRTIDCIYEDAWPTDVLNTEIHPLSGTYESKQTFMGKTYELGYEHCDKIGKWWFWMPDEKPRPLDELRHVVKQTSDAGGNLLLNVPPDKTGRIGNCHVKALMELKAGID